MVLPASFGFGTQAQTLRTAEAIKFEIKNAPQVWICKDSGVLHKFIGFVTEADIREKVTQVAAELEKPVTVKASPVMKATEDWRNVPETWPATEPIDGTRYPSHRSVLTHLRGRGNGGENHVNDYYQAYPLEQMTVGQLVTLHDRDHGHLVMNSPMPMQTYAPSPVYRYMQPQVIYQAPRQMQSPRMMRRRSCPGGNCPQ
jgi:hypothetical protein